MEYLYAAEGHPYVIFFIGLGLAVLGIALVGLHIAVSRNPELEKKLARKIWGDNANLEVYNRSGRWL